MTKNPVLPSLIAAFVAALTLAACSGDSSTAEKNNGSPQPQEAASTDDAGETEKTPALSSGTHRAGMLSANFDVCKIEGAEFRSTSNSEAIPGMASYGDHLYVLDADGNVRRFTHQLDDSCVLTLDADWADGGVHTTNAEDVSNISISESGRMLLSGGVFGVESVDLATMASMECAGAGSFVLAPDGKSGLGYFPGSALKEIRFTDTNCQIGEAELPGQLPFDDGTVQALTWIDGNLVAAGPDQDKNIKIAQVSPRGKVEWLGGAESDEARFGWVHGVAACTPGVCAIDTNYRRMQIRDTDGAWLTSVDMSEALSISGSAWWTHLEPAERGGNWLAVGVTPTGSDEAEGFVVHVSFPD